MWHQGFVVAHDGASVVNALTCAGCHQCTVYFDRLYRIVSFIAFVLFLLVVFPSHTDLYACVCCFLLVFLFFGWCCCVCACFATDGWPTTTSTNSTPPCPFHPTRHTARLKLPLVHFNQSSHTGPGLCCFMEFHSPFRRCEITRFCGSSTQNDIVYSPSLLNKI